MVEANSQAPTISEQGSLRTKVKDHFRSVGQLNVTSFFGNWIGSRKEDLFYFIAPVDDVPVEQVEEVIDSALDIAGLHPVEISRFGEDPTIGSSSRVAEAKYMMDKQKVVIRGFRSEEERKLVLTRFYLQRELGQTRREDRKEGLRLKLNQIDEKLSEIQK